MMKTNLKAAWNHTNGTLHHKGLVFWYLFRFAMALLWRGVIHDWTKFTRFEFGAMARHTWKLKGCTYGDQTYQDTLKALQPALFRHYLMNKHHPEHYRNGVYGMSLLDLVEMLYDWKAATKRHQDGNVMASIIKNRNRFDLGDHLPNILSNEIRRAGLEK